MPGQPEHSSAHLASAPPLTTPARRPASAATTASSMPCSRPRSTMVRATVMSSTQPCRHVCAAGVVARWRCALCRSPVCLGGTVRHGRCGSVHVGSPARIAADVWLAIAAGVVSIAPTAAAASLRRWAPGLSPDTIASATYAPGRNAFSCPTRTACANDDRVQPASSACRVLNAPNWLPAIGGIERIRWIVAECELGWPRLPASVDNRVVGVSNTCLPQGDTFRSLFAPL